MAPRFLENLWTSDAGPCKFQPTNNQRATQWQIFLESHSLETRKLHSFLFDRSTNFCKENITQRPSVWTRHRQGLDFKKLCFRSGVGIYQGSTTNNLTRTTVLLEKRINTPCLHWNPRCHYRAHNSQNWNPLQPNEWSPLSQYICLILVLIVSLDLCLLIPSGFFTVGCSTKNCMQLSSLPYVLRLTSSSLTQLS